jgi:uncharacterized membrane protein
MSVLIVLAILVIVGIPLIMLGMLSSIKSKQSENTDTILKRLANLEQTLIDLKHKQPDAPATKPAPQPEKPVEVIVSPTPPPIAEIITPPPVVPPQPEVIQETVIEDKKPVFEPVRNPEPVAQLQSEQQPQARKQNTPPPTPKKQFDYERFVGENLAGKIGIAVLVLGIGYFVKYAIDRDMINEAGRVALGLISGCILLGIAHWQRKAYRAFSSLLVAGGIATFYFTITIAFQEYQMFGQVPAFIIMVVITAFSVLLSLLYDRKELAALSLLGGLGAPFMVSTGQGNYIVLFTYLLILNTGMLWLAILRRWTIINTISFAGTVIIYAAWLINETINNPTPHYGGALLFASLFYVVFFVMNIIRQAKQHEAFTAYQTGILLLNTFLYFGVGMVLLNQWGHRDYQGIFTALLAVFNFTFGIVFYRNQMVDRRLVLYLFGIVLIFVSLVAPVQLKGNYITLFWAAEAAMLLWFSRPAQMPIAKTVSLLLVVLMIVSVVMDWFKYYGFGAAELPIIANKVFITCAACFAALAISRHLLRVDENPYKMGLLEIDNSSIGVFLDLMMAFITLGTLNFEALYQLNRNNVSDDVRQIVIMAINNWWVLAIFIIVIVRKAKPYTTFVAALGVFALLLNCLAQGVYFNLFKTYIADGATIQPGFALHYLNFVALAGIIAATLVLYRRHIGPAINPAILWALSFFGVFFLSTELSLHALVFNVENLGLIAMDDSGTAYQEYKHVLQQIIKAGFPVLWGICSFALMMLGMRQKNRHLRIISLTLFTLILAKLFIYDIRGISDGGRIIAFIILGILLLVISFMYQKIKKIILDDEETDS